MTIDLAGGAVAAVNSSAPADAVSMAMLKKAIALQEQGAAQLLQTLPAPAAINPPHLGNHLDTFA